MNKHDRDDLKEVLRFLVLLGVVIVLLVIMGLALWYIFARSAKITIGQ